MKKTIVTPEIAEYLKKNYMKYPSRALAEKIGISKSAVQYFLRKNNLKVPNEIVKQWKKESLKRPYTDYEKQYIINNIQNKSIKQIAKDLGRGSISCSKEAKKLGLGPIIIEKIKRTQFKKGHTPFTKGKKIEEWLTPEQIENLKKTQFKKGQKPPNTFKIGQESIIKDKRGRPYTMIKVKGKKTLEYKHRHIWQQHYGKIPKGHNIIFKDGDTLNCNIDNLECISDKELMQRNSINNLPEYLREIISIKSRITKQIKKQIKQ